MVRILSMKRNRKGSGKQGTERERRVNTQPPSP